MILPKPWKFHRSEIPSDAQCQSCCRCTVAEKADCEALEMPECEFAYCATMDTFVHPRWHPENEYACGGDGWWPV